MIHYMSTRGVGDAWVVNELRVCRRAGIPTTLHALMRPGDTYFASPDVSELERGTHYVYPLSWPRAVAAFVAAPIRHRGRFFSALWNALTGPRESLRARAVGLFHLFVACDWAAQQDPQSLDHVHSQWIHSAGTVAMYGTWLLGKSFSFTGHAADLFRERAALLDKIRRADFIVCISSFHRDFYLEHGARPEQLHIAYCGIDTSHFTPQPRERKPGERLQILSSGRLVEKKGFHVLLDACKQLEKQGVDFACTIGGSGPQEADLRARIERLGLGGRVELTGRALKQEDIPAFMAAGDVYCLPCVWASDDDVDGLPQMLMEAMACGRPVVSTRLVGIPDLVIDGRTGILVEPEQAEPLAAALRRILEDPELARRLAEAGRRHVQEQFDLPTCLDPLLREYRARLAQA